MNIIHARQPFDIKGPSVFLAGPTPRASEKGLQMASWRPEAISIFESLKFSGTLFVPENKEWDTFSDTDYYDQIEWEEEGLNKADCIMFWIPRNLETLPGFTTNDEWGFWKNSGKVVLGVPPNAEKCKYQIHYANKLNVPYRQELSDTVYVATVMAVHLHNKTEDRKL